MADTAILCVDDEYVVLESLKEQLRRGLGDQYIYEIAENAQEALEVIDEFQDEAVKILIIISDWLMPGMKGDEFLIEVHRRFPNIVKIMLTGQADDTAVERARHYANLHSCIAKPWNEKHLLATIHAGIG